jgi:zinc transport system permease protein
MVLNCTLTATIAAGMENLMLDIFNYNFMIRALIVGTLIAVIAPCIGIVVVLKRLSMMGDSLSHVSLAGVVAGLILSINPVMGAVFMTVIAAFGIERIRHSFPRYSEISIAVIMSAGIGLAGVLSGFVKNTASFNSFLFGSIVAISDFELYMIVFLCISVLIIFIFLYKELFYITFDEESARLAGIPVKPINFIFTIITAVTISVSARVVGTLIISSLLVLPVACAMQISKSYRQTVIISIIFALIFTLSGLFISYYLDLKPGGTIILVSVIFLIGIILLKNYPALKGSGI